MSLLHTYSSVAKRDSQPTSLLGVRCGSRPTFVYIFYRWCVRLLVNSICAGNVCVCVPLCCCCCLLVACWLLSGGKPQAHTRSKHATQQLQTKLGPETARTHHANSICDHTPTTFGPNFFPLSPPILTHFRRFAAKSRKRRESRTFGGICRISLPTTTVGVESGAGKC